MLTSKEICRRSEEDSPNHLNQLVSIKNPNIKYQSKKKKNSGSPRPKKFFVYEMVHLSFIFLEQRWHFSDRLFGKILFKNI